MEPTVERIVKVAIPRPLVDCKCCYIMMIFKQNPFQELHRDLAGISICTDKILHKQMSLFSCQVTPVPEATSDVSYMDQREKNKQTVAQWSKVFFSESRQVCISFEIKVPEEEWRGKNASHPILNILKEKAYIYKCTPPRTHAHTPPFTHTQRSLDPSVKRYNPSWAAVVTEYILH